jgi:uncharacterized membrane protein YphA (DoxX/SURF4 family)
MRQYGQGTGGNQMKSRLRKYFSISARLMLGALFIAASIDKIAHPGEFATIIHNYQILPDSLINIVAIVLPWLEGLLGFVIMSGFLLPGATVIANLLLFAFFSALIYNLARGLNIHCGCFTTKITGEPQTAWYIIRDSAFLLLGLTVLVQVFMEKRMPRSRIII